VISMPSRHARRPWRKFMAEPRADVIVTSRMTPSPGDIALPSTLGRADEADPARRGGARLDLDLDVDRASPGAAADGIAVSRPPVRPPKSRPAGARDFAAGLPTAEHGSARSLMTAAYRSRRRPDIAIAVPGRAPIWRAVPVAIERLAQDDRRCRLPLSTGSPALLQRPHRPAPHARWRGVLNVVRRLQRSRNTFKEAPIPKVWFHVPLWSGVFAGHRAVVALNED